MVFLHKENFVYDTDIRTFYQTRQ